VDTIIGNDEKLEFYGRENYANVLKGLLRYPIRFGLVGRILKI
jgi:hypothetical protein